MVQRQTGMSSQLGAVLGIIAIFIVLGVPLTVESAWLGAKELGETSAYDSARVCTSTADLFNCRFEGQARIVRTWTDKSYRWVEVAFDQLGGRKVSTDLDPNSPLEWQRWQPEDEVNAELWQGYVTVINGVRTIPNPDINQGAGITVMAWIAGSTTLGLSGAFAWIWVMWRRWRRHLATRLAAQSDQHPVTIQQLPLTPDMSDFLGKEMEVAAHPIQLALVVLGLAAVIPAIFTIVFIAERALFNPIVLFMWLFFLGLGAIATFALLRNLRQERRDTVGGVFNRATGVLSVKLNQSKSGAMIQVVIGGRKLENVTAPALESIESFTGGVDYLPVSGDTLEIRDESGHVLWSRFAKTAPITVAQSAAR